MTPHALDLFVRYQLPRNFLSKNPTLWENDDGFCKAKSILENVTVINDSAERGVKLIEDYNQLLTKNEDDLQFLLQVVTEYRKDFPSCAKKDLQKTQ